MFDKIIDIASVMAPFIVGFIEIIKPLMKKCPKLIPFVALVIGVLLSLLFVGVNLLAVKAGLIAGLMSVGAYNFVKKSLLRK